MSHILIGLAERIHQVSRELLTLNQGTLYASLARLEQRGCISSKWGTSENNRKARYYSITRAGRRRLAKEAENLERMAEFIGRVLQRVFKEVSVLIGGVTAYSVSRRTYEMGVRLALGAGRSRVVLPFVGRVLIFVMPGLAIGIVAAMILGRLMRSLLYEIAPTDPITCATVAALLALVAVAAGYLPARRAARIDPLMALKSE